MAWADLACFFRARVRVGGGLDLGPRVGGGLDLGPCGLDARADLFTVWPRQNVKPLQTLGLSMQN